MSLVEKIIALYPELKNEDFDYFGYKNRGTILVQDDGKGDYIAKWEHTLPRPTDEELA